MPVPAPPTIPTLPTAPARGVADPDTYVDLADAWAAAQQPWSEAVGDVGEWVEDRANEVQSNADTVAGQIAVATSAAETATGAAADATGAATDAQGYRDSALGYATAAAASANTADGFRATSASSVAIGLGPQSLTLAQTGKLFTEGSFVQIVDAADPTNFMSALISTFNAGTGAMTVDVKGIGGSGTKTSWTVSLAGSPGGAAASGTLTGVLNFAPTVTVASASTTDIGGANGNNVAISGTTTITSFGSSASAPEGSIRDITFTGTLTLTHNATSLILPGAANIVTAAGDTARAKSLGSGNWRVIAYSRASGLPVTNDAVMRRSLKTAGFNVTAADAGTVFELSASTAQTITVDALSTLPTNFSFWWVNTGAGIWTIDPNASEQIDGVTSFSILPGEARLVQRDGSAFKSTIVKPFFLTMTASGTFPVLAPGYTAAEGILWCSGCGGRKGLSTGAVPGGTAVPFMLLRADLATAQTVTIGGSASGSANTSVTAGNNSTFGSLITAKAGSQAFQRSTSRGSISATDASAAGDAYAGGDASTADAIYGGAAGGNSNGGESAPKSIYGGDGGLYMVGANGGDGQAPGGGGANADSGFTPGAGARGELQIRGVVG